MTNYTKMSGLLLLIGLNVANYTSRWSIEPRMCINRGLRVNTYWSVIIVICVNTWLSGPVYVQLYRHRCMSQNQSIIRISSLFKLEWICILICSEMTAYIPTLRYTYYRKMQCFHCSLIRNYIGKQSLISNIINISFPCLIMIIL